MLFKVDFRLDYKILNKAHSHKFSYFLCFLHLFLLFVFPVFAERLPIKTYTVADGLLRDNVYKIKQDSHGFLWFCTADGVSRFDGYGFTNFTIVEGLPDRHVNDFLETKNGTIYIATDNGLAKLNPTGIAAPLYYPGKSTFAAQQQISNGENPLFSVYLPENPRAKSFKVLFEDEAGVIWTGTGDGLYKLTEAGALEVVDLGISLPDSSQITSIIKDRRNALWIGTVQSGLIRLLPNGEVERFTNENGLPGDSVASLLEDKMGRIWVGFRPGVTLDDGLSMLVDKPLRNQKIVERTYSVKDGLPANWIPALFQTGDGQMWVATIRGLCRWQGENENSVCKNYTAKNDLCDQDVWTITEDKDGNLWLGTRCGAKKLARYGFTAYTESDGMGNPLSDSIFENAIGELFVTFNKGSERTISRFDGEKFDLVKPRFPPNIDYFGWGWKQTVWQDRTVGDWWIPTGEGLFRFPKPKRFEDLAIAVPQKISFGAKGGEIFRLFEDSRGDFWVAITGAANELWRWERGGNAWHDFSQETGVGKYRLVTAFAEDRSGNLWIGTGSDEDNSALIRYHDGRFQIFAQNEYELLAGWIHDLFLDHQGRLWIANTTSGLLRLDDVNAESLNFARYSTAEGLSSMGVSCVTEDEFGRIYVGTGRGLDRLNPQSGNVENFTTADGLPNSAVSIAYRDGKNNLWFGTSGGLARFVPEPERNREPPNVLITGLRVAGIAQPISILGEKEIPRLDFNSQQRQISVDFLGLGASLGEKLKYEYRLGESDWTPTSERTVNFANLASGESRFEVRAVSANKIYSAPAVVIFRIAAPLWQRWWFIAALVILAALLIYGFYRFRLSRLLEVANMRTRIATDLHDDIGANLTRISILSEVAKQKAANGSGKILTSIADIARESVASMNDIVWAISPEHDSLSDLIVRMRRHAEEIFALREIDLDFHAPARDLKLSVSARRDVLLIFKEVVNNAAKHSNCSCVKIEFRCENSVLFLRVADDGKGFDSKNEKRDGGGQGLKSITRRALALGGKLTIESKDESGTVVTFEMPLPNISRV